MSVVVWMQARPAVAWSLALACAVVIFLLSSIPQLEHSGLPAGVAVVEYVVEYALFSMLLSIAFGSRGFYGSKSIFLASLLYGVFDELHQFFVPGRDASMADVFADSIGCLIGVIAYRRLSKQTVCPYLP